jgi:hypothetical protein
MLTSNATRVMRTGPVAMMALAAACAPVPAINSDLKDAELRSRLDERFKPGMSLEQVQGTLDELHVARRLRRVYPGPPVQLLARLFPVGGYWVDNPEFQDVWYVDAWFLFAEGRLERVDTERRRMRVQHYQYMDPPFQTPELLPTRPRPVSGGADADQQ